MGRYPLALALSAGIAGLLLGCNEDPAGGSDIPDASTNENPDAAPDDCVAGTLLPCTCPDGEKGYAECVDGSWAECDCEEGEFPMFCGLCHGDWDYPAPPKDISGNTETSVVTVGAHRAHLEESDWHRPVECVDCHAVPKKMESPGHIDPSPADLTFAKVSIADGASPQFDRTIATCAGTYCHGSTLIGFASADPVWTDDDGSPGTCGSCHSLPPGGSHPTDTECENCHGNVVGAGNEIIAPNLHVDGIVQFSGDGLSCNTCHGGAQNAAPPVDTSGNTDPTIPTVGAHQSHLGTSTWHREVQCNDCHEVPESLEDCHNDGPPAEHVWSTLSSADGASPSYDSSTSTCINTYCHGATLAAGGDNPDPQWNVVASGEVVCGDCHSIPPCTGHPGSGPCAPCHDQVYDGTDWVNPQLHIDGLIQVIDDLPCGACHGMPPAAPHNGFTDCALCHGMVWDGTDWVDESLHDNGVVDVSGSCNVCHGNPPTLANQDFPGGGGAHEKHVTDLGMTCDVCHGHNGSGSTHAPLGSATVDQVNVDIAFDLSVSYPGGTTMDNGLTTFFSHNGGNPTCNVGCHNPVVGDTASLGHQATWTDTEIACSDCHEQPGLNLPVNHPVSGTTAQIRANCSECHDHSTHTTGTIALADPDPSDGIDPSATSVATDLCKTCHDGGSGTYFGGLSAVDMSAAWTAPSAHEDNSAPCTSCHGYHGGAGELVANPEETACATCHPTVVAEMSLSGAYSRHKVVDSEQSTGLLECVTCHEPHTVDDNPWIPVTDPDNGNLVAAADVPSDHFSTAGSDTTAFCLDCHDGTWTGATDIAAELASVWTVTSQFFRGGASDRNMHISHVQTHGFACTECHNSHSNTGTSGLNRGHLLYNYITVNMFPYTGKFSCGISGGPVDCHH